MKKILSIVSALVTVLAINATQVVLNPGSMPQMTQAGAYDQTIEGIHVQLSNGIVNESQIRIYKNQTITFSAQTPISAIVFTCTATGTSQYGPGCFAEQEGYTYESNKGTWDGSATSVAFTASSNQVRATQIVVYLDGEKPSTEQLPVDTIGVSEAIARIDANNRGECYIKGVVAGDPFLLGANGPAFYMTDIANPSDSLEAFKIGKNATTPFADVEDMASIIAMGDTILIYALGLDKYNNSIYETTTGHYVRTIGKSAANVLEWDVADATYENGNWIITIAATNANNPADALTLIFPSSVTNGIAGYHSLATGSAIKQAGVSTPITSGSVQLTFNSISNNNYNIYAVKMSALVGDATYRINNTIEIPAFDANGDEILLSADRPFTPKANDTITCAQAREYALSLASGESSPMTVTVRGFITDMFSNGVTFWMDDQAGEAKTIQAYSSTMPAGVSLDKGAEVYVTGSLKNYNGTPEIDHGTVTAISGGSEIVAQEVTVAEALAVAQALDVNATSTDYYAITGYISGIVTAYSEQYGNISFWMSDAADDAQNFQAYRAKCDASIADKLVVGAKVKVTDKLKHYYKAADEEHPDDLHTYETNGGGTVILIQGAGVEDINVNVPAVKFIENGRIIILRNGVRYDVQGRIAE